ncbi:MAG: FMN-binding glutamate synthase family protein [Gammaproteobacteria bacterium]
MGFGNSDFLLTALEVMSGLFIFVIGLVALAIVITFILDVSQNKQAIRHNYPVIGRFRYLFERLGEFFRQYFFSMDREELPFNRAQRSWVYRAAKDVKNTRAFGSTRDIRISGTVLFVNHPFPTLDKDAVECNEITIGPYCNNPYVTDSLVNISGMSYGAISMPAVLALSQGAYQAGCWMNTGEGGLSACHLEGGADLVYQIGTAKYGVRDMAGNLDLEKVKKIAAHPQIKMFELKLSQGAKPGKGGILPAEKVTEEIAQMRGIKAYEASISPNRHPDINTIDDLLDTIDKIRRAAEKPVGFKMVLGSYGWLDTLMETINRRGDTFAPDFITLDSSDGGTGAAPMPLMDDVGLPLRETLPVLIDKLNEYGLRDRIKVIASGKLITPTDVAWAICMGADFVVSARGFMFALGCIQALQCNKNTCPTGITTHNPRLQKGLNPELKSVRVSNYVRNLVHDVGIIAHSCGVTEPRHLGRQHARMVTENGLSIALDELHPDVKKPLTD